MEAVTSAIKRVLREHTRLVTGDMCDQVLHLVPDTGKIGSDSHGLVGEKLRDMFDELAESKGKEVVEAHRLLGVLIHHLQVLAEHSKVSEWLRSMLLRLPMTSCYSLRLPLTFSRSKHFATQTPSPSPSVFQCPHLA